MRGENGGGGGTHPLYDETSSGTDARLAVHRERNAALVTQLLPVHVQSFIHEYLALSMLYSFYKKYLAWKDIRGLWHFIFYDCFQKHTINLKKMVL